MKDNTKEGILARHPDKAEIIEKAFIEMDTDDGCKGCKKNGKIRNLLIELGELKPVRMPDYSSSNGQVPEYLRNAGAPRPQCENCYKEHIAKAIINLNESIIGNGYPQHRWLAIGNLAEASAEIVGLDPEKAKMIRDIKLKMILEKDFMPNLMVWLEEDKAKLA